MATKKPTTATAPTESSDQPSGDEDLVAAWRKDPAFERWALSVCESVVGAATPDIIKRDAGTPTNDLILGAELARKRMLATLVKALLRDPRTPKAKALSMVVQSDSRGFEMS